jgi:DHA1 family multidrug resistance protein-like MFS transporter/DHA1 family quinolone resistance protein-like MFS transporter
MASPIIPLYSSSLGASYIQIGIIGTAYGLVYAICAVPLGRLSDKLGRKVIMLLGAVLCAFAAAFYSIATTVNQIMLIRAVEGLAWAAFWPSIEALTADVSHVSAVGRTMGFSTASYGAGFALGALMAGTLASFFSYRYTFLFYLASSILAAFLVLATIREPKGALHEHTPSKTTFRSSGLKHRANILADLISMVYSIVLMTILTLLPVYAEGLGIEVFSIGILMMMLWVARITSFLNAGRFSDKMGRKLVLTPSLAGLAIGSFLLAVSETWLTLVLAVIVIGLSLGALFPVSIALISDHVPSSQRGVAMGMFETASAVGQTIGPAVGGVLAERFSPSYPYLFCAIASMICTLVVGIFLKKRM